MKLFKKLLYIVSLLSLFFITCSGIDEDILSKEERAWLLKNNGKIVIDRYIESWAPMESYGSDGALDGIAADYFKLIEKKLNFSFKIDAPYSWEDRLKRLKNGDVHVGSNIQKTPKRSKYLLFTKPYIEIPNVIIVRKGIKGSLNLDKIVGMKVAVTRGFAIHEFLSRHNLLNLVAVDSDHKALIEVSLRRVDAAVLNLAAASYIIEKEGITNLRVAGRSGYNNKLSFGSVKNIPILNRILKKGLASITIDERKEIYKKWIHLELPPFYKNETFQITAALLLIILTVSFLWNACLRKEINKRIKIQEDREKIIEELEEAIGEIKTLSGLLPICASCKKIRDGKGYWNQIEEYIEKHTDALFSHGICSECQEKIYGNENWYNDVKD